MKRKSKKKSTPASPMALARAASDELTAARKGLEDMPGMNAALRLQRASVAMDTALSGTRGKFHIV